MPKLSIIIPIYNVADYLRHCLDSIINQTLHDIEIVCVNDGSTDDSDKILTEYAKKDKRIIIITQPNAGQAAARNAGIRRNIENYCKYISFLDPDDWIALDFYEKLINAAEENGADIAASDMIYYYSKNRQESDNFVSFWTFGSGKKLLQTIDEKKEISRSCSVCNKIYRTDLIIKNNLTFYHGKFVEDVSFAFLSVVLSDKITLCKDAKMYYRQRENSTMANAGRQNKIIFDAIDNHETLLKDFEKLNLPHRDKKEWRSILEQFTFDNLFGWSGQLNPNNKDRFFTQFVKIIDDFDIPLDKWRKQLSYYIFHHNSRIIKVECTNNKIKYKLFGLSIWKIKNKGTKIRYYLLGIPLMKI